MASHDTAVAPDISAISPLIEWVEHCCGGDGVDDGVTFKMMLAVEEALANVVAHAFIGVPPPHLIRVRLDIAAGRGTARSRHTAAPARPWWARHPSDATDDRPCRIPPHRRA